MIGIRTIQLPRVMRLPFSHGGRNFLYTQLFYRGKRAFFLLARFHRTVIAPRKRVIMVVGTYGKTTTTRAVTVALGQPLSRWLDTNPNSHGMVAWSLLRQPPWRRHVAIEVGIAGPGHMATYAAVLSPQIVVVTSIGLEHIQSYENIEHLRREKAEAVRLLPPAGLAVLNGDDPHVSWMTGLTRARVIRFGFDPAWEVHVRKLETDWPHGMRVTLGVFGETHELRTRLMGKNSVYALLAAVAVGVSENQPVAKVLARLQDLPPTPGRLEMAPLLGGAFALCDDYKSSLETVHAAISVLAEVGMGRRFIVLGGIDSPPNPKRKYYREVAEQAGQVADHVIVVGKFVELYTGELGRRRQGPDRLQAVDFVDRVSDAVAILREKLQPGDVVLIKGRVEQHLRRIVLALQGRDVRCAVDICRLHQYCGDCPLLGRPSPVGGLRLAERVVLPGPGKGPATKDEAGES
jgi:UDP-N-acetylmuramyl pentapeptide synthase